MIDLLDYAPIAAAGFAVPQFLPQIRKLRATRDTAGASSSWAALTSVNNAAWIAYFTMSRPPAWPRAGPPGHLAHRGVPAPGHAVALAAYRTARPTGISSGTWLLILGELSCWMIFGLHTSDPRLITLGASGIIVSALMLARIHRTTRSGRPALPASG